ncbi:uncharacterized protein METZ01_LOCUS35632 [marine metagenome]|uniref:Uncharacterized protein n=1 Tax=marine metagenome TaxID=408172 RepID=A0A381QVY9_9ZZZZ
MVGADHYIEPQVLAPSDQRSHGLGSR